MSPSQLIFVDAIISLPLKLLSIFISFVNRFRRKPSDDRVLIIKFLGAGNFVSYVPVITALNCDFVTVLNNKGTIRRFLPSSNNIYIDDSNILRLLFSSISTSFRLALSRYDKVVNLESESSFSKFISSLPVTNNRVGISNKHKSLFDRLFYNFYLVSPTLLSRPAVLRQLLCYSEASNVDISNALVAHNARALKNIRNITISKVVIAPTCSLTDANRRLPDHIWLSALKRMTHIQKIIVLFPNKSDLQYNFFEDIGKIYSNLFVSIKGYDAFVNEILTSDILFTIDSQALHVAQSKQLPTIAIYGPTSPYGVELSPNTLVISKSLACSPCTHKYLRLPCNGENYCTKFDESNFLAVVAELGIVN